MNMYNRKRPVSPLKDFDIKVISKSWTALLNYMGPFKKWFLLCSLLAFVSAILTLVGPNLLSNITDLIEDGILTQNFDIEGIYRIGFTLVVIYGTCWGLMIVGNITLATITQRVASKLRTDISRKINRLPLKYFDKATTGDLLSRVSNDVDTVGQSLNQSLNTLITMLALLIGSGFMMFYTDLTMAIVGIITTVIGLAIITFIMAHSQKFFVKQQVNLGKMNGLIEESYSGYITVRAYSGEEINEKTFDEINENLRSSGFMSQFLSALTIPLMGFISNIGYVAVCIMGAILFLQGDITFGVIVAFMMYIRFFTQSFSQISQTVVVMQSLAAASERVFEFLREEEMDNESHKTTSIDTVTGKVEFRDVHFGYEPNKEIIHGFNVTVQPGEVVAIVGPTGAGKTTIVNLLMRFYDIDSGEILIDGIPVNTLTRNMVHDMFCMVLQDTWLFEGTLRENLVYNKEGVTNDELDAVCEAVGLSKFVNSLPNRYDTVFTDNAAISVGQRQQITIARAMIKNAPLLILDEATSSVDTMTELDIQNAMKKLSKNKTSFIIAHRLSTIRDADIILVMKNGDIIEQGSHDELMKCGGFYTDLYNSQFAHEVSE